MRGIRGHSGSRRKRDGYGDKSGLPDRLSGGPECPESALLQGFIKSSPFVTADEKKLDGSTRFRLASSSVYPCVLISSTPQEEM